MRRKFNLFLSIVGIFFLSGCATSKLSLGSSKASTVATGSAAGSTSKGENNQLEKCSQPLGTVAFHEDRNADWFYTLSTRYHLPSTLPVLRLLAQQSNCFVVVERGKGIQNMMQERELMRSGELRGNSNFTKGQMVAADYTIIPSVTFSAGDTGGLKGIVGALFGPVAGAVAGAIKHSDASTLLTLIDNRSGVQLAAAAGSARNTDFNILGGLFAGVAGGGLGAYSNTPEGKVIVAAFTDSMNKLIQAIREYKAQHVKGGLGTGGVLKVQGATRATSNLRAQPALIQTYEGVMVIRKYVPSQHQYYYKIITKDKSQSFEFYSPNRIPYKNDLVRFRVVEGEVDPESLELLERRYLQKYW